ncbi:type IV pilin protein [Thiorhodococcus minor]
MIVVAVVGVLAAIAYPSYQSQVQKSRRTVAESALTEIASKLEAYRFRHRTYTEDLGDLGYSGTGDNAWNYFPSGATAIDSYYRVQVAATDSGCAITNCYRLLAEPLNSQVGDKWQYLLWSTGRKQSRKGASATWTSLWPSQ